MNHDHCAEPLAGLTPSEPPGARSLSQRTLTSLRWVAIVGQSATVLVSQFALGMDLPFLPCALCIGVSVAVNLASWLWPTSGVRLTERAALLTLIYDMAQLTALLFLTGGLSNPFSLFLVAPVTVAAIALSLPSALILGALGVAATMLLAFAHIELQLYDGTILNTAPHLQAGLWVAIPLGVAFQGAYLRRISNEAFEMSAALTATRLALEREQRLSAIGALAAAAAHELGTPLATIKLTARELRNELADRPDLAEDAELIAEQAGRCREILERLSALRAPEDEQTKTAPISTVVEEAAAPHRWRRATVTLRVDGVTVDPDGKPPAQPIIPRRPEIIHGLRNLVQNAVDFAASRVWIDIDTLGDEISVRISDDGAGFSPDMLVKLGEPFATTRGRAGSGAKDGEDAYEGMGLGVFISKNLLERTGAVLCFGNGGKPHRAAGRKPAPPQEHDQPSGAVVMVRWPRQRLRPDAAAHRSAGAEERAFAQGRSGI